MPRNIKKDQRKEVDLNYLNKDFNSFQKDLRLFANNHFSDQIQDFSESGLGGLFVDMAAYVGDVLSYYLDHQFNELDIRTTIEPNNIERIAKNSGIKLSGASPAVVEIEFYAKIPSKLVDGIYVPDPLYLFRILQGTKIASNSGLEFELIETLDFGKRDNSGNLVLDYRIGDTSSENVPINFIGLVKGMCVSASTFSQTFEIGSRFIPFRSVELDRANVGEIVSVKDSELNEYYEVDNLAMDTVFESVETGYVDSITGATSNLRVIPAPRRYIRNYSRRSGKTQLIFGSGRSDTYEDDNIPNPADHAISLFGDRKVFSKIALDPNQLLDTNTLGVSPTNTILTVTYRAGGGSKFNVQPGTLTIVKDLITDFDTSGVPAVIRSVRNSVEVDNEIRAIGGSDRLTDEELRAVVAAGSSTQNRIVSKKDLLTRLYTMPSRFGRLFRAGVRSDPENPNASIISGICIDDAGKLQYATDILKNNIGTYIDEFRIIGDAIDILDAPVVNLSIEFEITSTSIFNKQNTVSNVIQKLKRFLRTEKMQIDQPINISEIETLIQLTEGVGSVNRLEIKSNVGVKNNFTYLGEDFSVSENVRNKLLYPPIGGIFEFRFPSRDIKGRAL